MDRIWFGFATLQSFDGHISAVFFFSCASSKMDAGEIVKEKGLAHNNHDGTQQ